MEYLALIEKLESLKDEKYRDFQARLVNSPSQKIIGVRTPILRELAKELKDDYLNLLSFSDEYYEVTFIKLNAVALLPYAYFIQCVDKCVECIDNWAICDTFKAKCIKKNKEEFKQYIDKYLNSKQEFFQRYALVTLLSNYVEEKYLTYIFDCLKKADNTSYYVYMGSAWLLAEVLVKQYDKGVEFLKQNLLDIKTHNKAIQKARESYRLNNLQKEELNNLKRY